MAERQPAQRRAGVLDNVEDWMAQRNADAYRLKRDAEAAGREAWERATTTGENLAAMRPSDVLALGAKLLKQGKAPPAPQGHAASIPVRKLASVSARPNNPGLLDHAGKAAAKMVALPAGRVVGAARGARNTIRDVGSSVNFVSRLMDPLDATYSAPGEAAWGQVFEAGDQVLRYAKNGVSNPGEVVADLGGLLRKARTNLDLGASPGATTVDGELKRNYEIGKNQGELAFDVGSTLYGGAVAKEIAGLGYLSKEAQIAKRLKQGFNPTQAAYLAEPYKGRGHHNVARSFTLQEKVGPLPLPKAIVGWKPPEWFIESPFNVLSPQNISRGDFYELHYKVDPRFHHANLPYYRRTGGWDGEPLGLKKYEGLERVWHSSPAPLKAAAGASATGTGALIYDRLGEETPR
ncbi:hypothetical protein [Phenylobacterium sp.]|uniref:hypothetical protein n=1 Tax=Phenylobacterium sp. TaxID=1871053 RepID=UPI002728660D|nr:hypothetical protein [Phenylobacterium sp.]MDO8378656.1 hypothetical protein [Phenylobacterium sp.]